MKSRALRVSTDALGGAAPNLVNKAKIDAGIADFDLHFNDLRGTAATKFYIADLSMREIAEILAWEEATVEKIIRRYVGRRAAVKAMIKKLEAKNEQTRQNRRQNLHRKFG